MSEVAIPVEPLDAESFRPFGEIIEPRSEPPVFRGTGLQSWRLGYQAEGTTELMVITYEHQPMVFSKLERHHRVTQCFIPMSNTPMVMVVAPRTGSEPPRIDAVRAFLVPGDRGVLLGRGIWHALNRYPTAGMGVYALLTTAETQAELEAEKRGGPQPVLTDVHDYAGDGLHFRVEG